MGASVTRSSGAKICESVRIKSLAPSSWIIFWKLTVDNLRLHGLPVTCRAARPAQPRAIRNTFFVNRRFVRDRLIGRALSEGYRSILPHGVYPAALLFIETPLEEVDVNVSPGEDGSAIPTGLSCGGCGS